VSTYPLGRVTSIPSAPEARSVRRIAAIVVWIWARAESGGNGAHTASTRRSVPTGTPACSNR